MRATRRVAEHPVYHLAEMVSVQLRLLGGFELKTSGSPVPLARKKAQALLAYLACHAGQAQPRDKLATLLWPDMDDEQARANLRKALFVLRPPLAAVPSGLRIEEDAVALDVAALDVDVASFERLVRQGTPQALHQAAELYRGDLLAGLAVATPPFEEWLTAERERLRELALEALARLLAHQTKADEPRAVETARRLLALDPLQEAVHRTLMRLYAHHGRRDAALRQYQSCVDILQRELRVEPEAATRQLYQEVLRDRATPSASVRAVLAGVAAPRAAQRPPSPLPDEAPMVGRQPEFAHLLGALDEAEAGRGQSIAVLGEAGIGKSRLTSQLGVEAAKRGALRLVGRAYPTEQMLAYGPWIEALRAGGVLDRDDVLARLTPACRVELARLFPELATPDEPPAPNLEDAMRLFEAVAHLLEALARAHPLVIMLEDVHWADEMSVRLTSVLSRRVAAWPILIVLTAREEEVADAPVLRDLVAMPSVERLRVGPLSQEETMALVRSPGPRERDEARDAALGERIWAVSGGNPFVIVETLRAVEQGAIPRIGEPLPMPERVSELVRGRIERLSERGQALACLAATVGRDFRFPLLQRASGLGEEEAAAGVEELVRRRVLRAVDEQLAFVHDRVREVVYAGLLPFRRKLLHRQVAEALEALHTPDLDPYVAALGRHYHGGEVWDKAVAYLRQAGARATHHGAYGQAAALYDQALGALEHLPDSRRRVEDMLDLCLRLRNPLLYLAEVARIRAVLDKARTLAETIGDHGRLAHVLAYQAYEYMVATDYRRALEAIQLVTDMCRSHGIDAPPELDRILGAVRFSLGEYRSAVEALKQAEQHESGRSGLAVVWTALTTFIQVRALVGLGEFDEARACADRGFRAGEELNHHHALAIAAAARGFIALGQGDADAAVPAFERAVGLTREGRYEQYLTLAVGCLGSAYLLAGRVDEALTCLHEAAGRAQPYQMRFSVWLADACLEAGRVDEARHLAGRCLRAAQQIGERATQAEGLHLLGEIASRAEPGDAQEAERCFREALAVATELGLRPLAAGCHLSLGRHYRRTGKRQDGEAHLATAMTLYREMNMRRGLEQAEAELARRLYA
jgi:DNA-binding SARP family transcriptional activator